MPNARTLRTTIGALLVVALSAAAGTASATTPPLTAGPGCSVQCITKAKVTATATAAKVELGTNVPAFLKVTVSKASTGPTGGLTANGGGKTVYISVSSTHKTAYFLGLEPNTTYRITVTATDIQGRAQMRSGTFKTLPIKTTGHGGPDTIDSGTGCSKQCITKALVSQQQPEGTTARLDIRTSTTAHIQIDVSRDKPVPLANGGLAQYDVVSRQWTPGPAKAWAPVVTGLDYGTKYYVVVRARDSQGRVSFRQGSFRTVSATATITLHYIKVLNDGDKGSNTGEMFFHLWLHDQDISSWGTGLRKLDSGDVTHVNPSGTSRPGFTFQVSANGDAEFSMLMNGEECDKVLKKNCLIEHGRKRNFDDWASAGGRFDVSQLLEADGLPGWYGAGVTPPAGHDGYFVFGTTDRYVKFLVLATIDLDVDWP